MFCLFCGNVTQVVFLPFTGDKSGTRNCEVCARALSSRKSVRSSLDKFLRVCDLQNPAIFGTRDHLFFITVSQNIPTRLSWSCHCGVVLLCVSLCVKLVLCVQTFYCGGGD